MCVLWIAWRVHAGAPILVAANRDEDYGRAFHGPQWIGAPYGAVLEPRDERAGGTWLGVSARGLAAAITNRPDGRFDPGRPSRGTLCADALRRERAADIVPWLEDRLARAPTNAFNLFFADRRRAFVASWNEELRVQALEPGVYLLSNDHGLGELESTDTEAVGQGTLDAWLFQLRTFLARHEPFGRTGLRICKHGDRAGTVCASIVTCPEAGEPLFEWAPGPPCRTPFTLVSNPAPPTE